MGEAVAAGTQWKWRQTKEQECQMGIMLHGPRGLKCVFNTSCSCLAEKPPGDNGALKGIP